MDSFPRGSPVPDRRCRRGVRPKPFSLADTYRDVAVMRVKALSVSVGPSGSGPDAPAGELAEANSPADVNRVVAAELWQCLLLPGCPGPASQRDRGEVRVLGRRD